MSTSIPGPVQLAPSTTPLSGVGLPGEAPTAATSPESQGSSDEPLTDRGILMAAADYGDGDGEGDGDQGHHAVLRPLGSFCA
jgi:hypothetical protein